ncbi:MAG: ferredoxin--NADP reductase, partial [Hyphomicrobiaceae bacterium]|nr:ferredoxin--NADP reductase [Hyphomicrobiaceae bacterium]
MSAHNVETVLSVHHWTDDLFSFTATRSPAFRFRNGQFTMIGLEVEGRPLLRAYSMASANYEDQLEFFSIKVPDGPLTSRLRNITPGDQILVGRKPVGTLVLDHLLPGRRLYLLSTGTGLAPFMSIIKDPETYERFDTVVLVHGCRTVAELAYGDRIRRQLPQDDFLGESIRNGLIYYPTVTREPFERQGRVTDLVTTGKLTANVGLPPIDAADDRVMLCGSPQMVTEMRSILCGRGFVEGNTGDAG